MRFARFAAPLLLAAIALPLAAQTAERPWLDAKLSPEARADLLLKSMTLDEKIALLHGPMAVSVRPRPDDSRGRDRFCGLHRG